MALLLVGLTFDEAGVPPKKKQRIRCTKFRCIYWGFEFGNLVV